MKNLLHILLILVFSQCENKVQKHVHEPVKSQTVQASGNGAVSTANPLATAAAVRVLEKGGNAVDAAIAASYTLAVVEPSMSGLGGRMQVIVRNEKGEIFGIDATTQAPAEYNPDTAPQAREGYDVIGIPGLVRGLQKLRLEHGTLPLADLMETAVFYAENGFEVMELQAKRYGQAIESIRKYPGTASVYLNADTTWEKGAILIQKDLANTLKTLIKNGEDDFYSGEIASEIIEDLKKHKSSISAKSLEAYKAEKAEILSTSYRGNDVYSINLPSYGLITLEILNLLNRVNTEGLSEADWAEWMYLIQKRAYQDRMKFVNDSITKAILSNQYLDTVFSNLKNGKLVNNGSGEHIEGHTTHLSVIDKDGMMVALTQSLGPNMGSKVITPGLGFIYASTLGGYLGEMQPEQRASSHISPTLVVKDGKPYMALGAAGGSRIIPAIVHAISRVVDYNMNPGTSLMAGRVYANDTIMQVENHPDILWKEGTLETLKMKPYFIEEITDPGRFGRVHMVMYSDSIFSAAADPDWEGSADSPEGQ